VERSGRSTNGGVVWPGEAVKRAMSGVTGAVWPGGAAEGAMSDVADDWREILKQAAPLLSVGER
jgi:hypothetical protein